MKNIFKKISVLLMMICMLVCASCSFLDDPTTDTPSGDEITYTYTLSDTSLSLEVGETKQLNVTVEPEKTLEVAYASSNAEVASVSGAGLVTAVSAGSAEITATVDGQTLKCNVTVKAVEIKYTYTLSATTLTLEEEQTSQLTVNVSPEKDITPVFATSNAEVATVSETGLVTAVGVGEATITATVDGQELTCAVTVTAKPIEYTYQLNFKTIAIEEEQTKKLLVIVSPSKDITPEFVSSNTAVATVDQTGLVTGISEGEATITVTVDGQELTCAVTVSPKPIVYTYEISATEMALQLGKNGQLSINVTPTPEVAVVPTWESDNEEVATVSATGLVQAVGVGSATITATVAGETFTCTVTVTSSVAASVQEVLDIAGQNFDLTRLSDEYETLYWEHYQSSGADMMLNAEDLILTSSAAEINNGFGDYKAKLGWSNGTVASAWDYNSNGICVGADMLFEIKVTPNVKRIVIFTGAWRATGTVTLAINGVELAKSAPFTAGDDGIARMVTFDLEVSEEAIVLVKIAPTDRGESGNTSCPGIVVLGEEAETVTTNVSMNRTEMTGPNDWHIDLSLRGTIDWYYVNGAAPDSNKAPDEKLDGTAIDTSVVKGNGFWDYKAAFTWNDGTHVTANPTDDDIAFGINNGKCDGAMRVDVTVNSNTKHVYLYVGGYQSNYYINVINSKGMIIYNEFLHEATGGAVAYELDFAVNATEEDKLAFIVYRVGGGNCSLAAVAVSDRDIEYTYTLSQTEYKLNIAEVRNLEVTVDPKKNLELAFKSSDENVAKVDENGQIVATGLGEATITVTVDGKELTCLVKVVEIEYTYNLVGTEVTMEMGTSKALEITATPAKDDIVAVWNSLNPEVATVENGVVVARKAGEAKITATIGETVLECVVTVEPISTDNFDISSVTLSDIAGNTYDLTNFDSELDTLYWEHYQERGTDGMMNATDLIVSNNIQDGSNFGDYGAKFGWSNGTNITSWGLNNTNGKHTNGSVPQVEAVININEKVKQLQIFVGAWNMRGVVTLELDGAEIARSEEFTAGSSIARLVVFDINVRAEEQIIIKVIPLEGGGNVSNQAIVILGEDDSVATSAITSLETTTMVGYNETHINLTQKGDLDWYYASYDRIADEKANASLIDSNSVEVEGNNWEWGYTAAFNWTDGTTYPTSPIDNDCNNQGTNNVRFGSYYNVDITVNENTKFVYLYGGSYLATYHVEVIDSKGAIIYKQALNADNSTTNYEVKLEINATKEEKLTFVVYITSGYNCSLSAVAVASRDTLYTLNTTSVQMSVNQTQKLSVFANPTHEFEVVYESLNTEVATVEADGTITGVSAGNATIKATIGEHVLLCEVEVIEEQIVYEYTLNKTEVALDLGQTEMLTVSVTPETLFEVVWASDDDAIATVENGLVKALSNGKVKITATIGETVLECMVTVSTSVTAVPQEVVDAAGKEYYLTDLSDTYETLYWEQYQDDGRSGMMGATDLIVSNTILDNHNQFYDYKATLTWENGTALVGAMTNRGYCIGKTVTMTINVNPSVKQIVVFTGAWRATGTVVMYLNGTEIARAASFTAGDDGIARMVTFDLAVAKESQVTIDIIPSEIGDSGNISNPAVVILGEKEVTPASETSIVMTKTELPKYTKVNLTEKGTLDWFYMSFDRITDRKAENNGAILADTLSVQGNGYEWNSAAAFNWSDGSTVYPEGTVIYPGGNSPVDNDCDNQGTNNWRKGVYVSIKVKVDASTSNVIIWTASWTPRAKMAVLDANGNVIFSETLYQGNQVDNVNEVNFAVTAAQEEELTFVIYCLNNGGCCGMSAVAVN